MRLDLHLHTTASDGACSPAGLVAAAVAGRLDVIAITDHDTIAGFAAATAAAEGLPLQVIPSIEASSTHEGRELHFLGYGVDPEAPALLEHEERAVRLRHRRIERMVDRLGGAGIRVEFDAVLEEAGPERSALGRPHLAKALVGAGHATSVPDAFDRLIGDQHPAFIPTELATPSEAVRMILASGGIPVWAHPPWDAMESLLPGLIAAGLQGIEVYRPRSSPNHVSRLRTVADTHGLLLTGGSDWHSPDSGQAVGEFFVNAQDIAPFLDALGI